MGKFYHLFYLCSLLGVNLQSGALLVRTEEQINEADDQKECYYSADTESTGGDQRTDLIYTQGYHICQTALIQNHLVLFISRLIAPIAAKQGAHSRLNARNA